MSHPLAKHLIEQAKIRELPFAELTFDLSNTQPRVTVLDKYLGQQGEMLVTRFTIESLDQAEDHILVTAVTDTGELIDPEIAQRFFWVQATDLQPVPGDHSPHAVLSEKTHRLQEGIRRKISERNALAFEQEADKLDGWADDLKITLERDLKDLDRQIKEAKRAATAALTLEEKLAGQKQVKALESHRNTKRRSLFDAQDDIDSRREALIADIEAKLEQKTHSEAVASFRWRLI
jgi:adenine-specific DNA-methyltransferase